MKPLVHVWEPASADVNWYWGGSTAFGSELVKLIRLLMIVSRPPLTVAVTVTVKGAPAVAVDGAVKLRTAWGPAQPDTIEKATADISAKLIVRGSLPNRNPRNLFVFMRENLKARLRSRFSYAGEGSLF